MTVEPWDACREAIAAGQWQTALDLLDRDPSMSSMSSMSADPEAIELRASAAYGAGELEACLTAWEQLHECFLERDDLAEAARAAAMLAMYLMMDTGLMAPVRGWLRRARTLLDRHRSAEGHDDVPAKAIIAMVATYERLLCGDVAGVREHSALAIALGEQLGVLPAVVIGQVAAARARIFDGEIQEGLDQLDEVGALLMTGQVDPLTTGMMYCELICVAQGMALHERAHEWTEVMERWRPGAAFGGIHGRCRVHRAEMLRHSGPCDRAEAEALRACDELRPWMRREFGWPLVELGTIRLRRGDLDGAEESFRSAHEHAWCVQPGLALVEFERGRVGVAADMIAEAIARPVDIPSKERPPFTDLCEAPLREAQVEIAVAQGDRSTAVTAARRLTEIAAGYPSRSLDASALLAEGRVALVSGEAERAVECCAEAVSIWSDVGSVYEASVARGVLGEALAACGNVDAARREWRLAAAALERFGAVRRAAQIAARADGEFGAGAGAVAGVDVGAGAAGDADADVGAAGAAGDADTARHDTESARARAAGHVVGAPAGFRLEAGLRVVSFGGSTVRLTDLKGFRHVARLLGDPGREFHALDLVAVERGTLPTGRPASAPVDPGVSERARGDEGLPLLDDLARTAYRRRLAEVEEDLDDARAMNDLGRIELAERDRDYLMAELSRALGLSGRHRSIGSDAERARTSVTRSIRYAIQRLADAHPSLAAHLDLCVHTGVYCAYRPDPVAPIAWHL